MLKVEELMYINIHNTLLGIIVSMSLYISWLVLLSVHSEVRLMLSVKTKKKSRTLKSESTEGTSRVGLRCVIN